MLMPWCYTHLHRSQTHCTFLLQFHACFRQLLLQGSTVGVALEPSVAWQVLEHERQKAMPRSSMVQKIRAALQGEEEEAANKTGTTRTGVTHKPQIAVITATGEATAFSMCTAHTSITLQSINQSIY